jgi:hypothetical protein
MVESTPQSTPRPEELARVEKGLKEKKKEVP